MPSTEPERPRTEPEIIPPDRIAEEELRRAVRLGAYEESHRYRRISVTRIGPLGMFVLALLAGAFAMVLLLLLVGAFLICVYRGRIGRTISETDNTWFTLLTNNTNQIHFNVEYAKRTDFGRLLVNSTLTLAIVVGLGVADVSENGFALGWDKIDLPNPVFVGDTLYCEQEIVDKRESRSKPQWGLVKVKTRGLKQDGTVVIEFVRTVMVWKRAHAPLRNAFPKARIGG
ncbi:MAG TPA: MaoC family dehydratase [Xanthobacteraceae bacterium]|nr:MaoC family dehydratase [Xanthobacteraceae bacterium]